MSAYKKRKLIAFSKLVGLPMKEPVEIIHTIAFGVVCEATDGDCPALKWCHANKTMPPNLSAFEGGLFCHKQLLEWWRK